MPQQKQLIASSLLVGKGNTQKQFDFDSVATPDMTQKELYELSVGDSVRRNLFRGYNTTIFAYGQTGSGKTYTMGGRSECDRMELAPTDPSSRDGSEKRTFGKSWSIGADDGIIPRAVHDLFKAKQDYESSGEVSITMTFMEIYNEEIYDLMTEGNTGLKLRDHGDGGIVVKGLTIAKVLSTNHARELIDRASSRRRTASTNVNMRSSRSHSICTFSVTVNPTARSDESTAATLGNRTSQLVSAKLTLVDLAGSERLKQTGAIGTTQKESININKDLFVLGKVVSALAEKNKGNTKIHVPYRDSNLTRLLRDSIGGNCCTVMIACVSPTAQHQEESINTLRYAERARTITNSVKQNVTFTTMSPSDVAAMRGENNMLKSKLSELRKRLTGVSLKRKKNNKTPGGDASDDGSMSTIDFSLPSVPSTLSEGKLDSSIAEKKNSIHRLNKQIGELEGKIQKASQENPTSPVSSHWDLSISESQLKKQNLALQAENAALLVEIERRQREAEGMPRPVLQQKLSTKEAETQVAQVQEELRISITAIEARRDKLLLENSKMEERLKAASSDLTGHRDHFLPTSGQSTDIELAEIPQMSLSGSSAKLMAEAEVARREKEKLQLSLSKSEARITMLEQAEHSNDMRLNEADDQLTDERTMRSQYEKDLEKVKEEVESLKLEKGVFIEQLASVQQELITLRARDSQQQNVLKEFNEREVELMAENRTLKLSLDELKKTTATLRQEVVRRSSNQKDSFRSSITKASSDLNSALKEAGEVENVCNSQFDEMSVDASRADSLDSSQQAIRQHAAKMLLFASEALEKSRSSRSVCSSVVSTGSNATDLKPDFSRQKQKPPKPIPATINAPGRPPRPAGSVCESSVHISGMEALKKRAKCNCQSSIFSGNSAHVEFYLPKLGMACTCGKGNTEPSEFDGEDPSSLENILRPWQAQFLKSVGIHNGVDFVHEQSERNDELARKMRRWRKAQNLVSVKTKSCGVALHIWSRTCKAVIRSVRQQKSDGATVVKKPDFLEVASCSDEKSVSTLGNGTIGMGVGPGAQCIDFGSQVEL